MRTAVIVLLSLFCISSLISGLGMYYYQLAEQEKEKEKEKEQAAQVAQLSQATRAAQAEKAAQAAQAAEKIKKVVHRRTNKCLDSNGNDIYIRPCGSDFQRWGYENNKLRHVQTEKRCLSMKPFVNQLKMDDCNDNDRLQKWIQSDNFIKHDATGICLDSNGSNVYTNTCDQNNIFQEWDILKS